MRLVNSSTRSFYELIFKLCGTSLILPLGICGELRITETEFFFIVSTTIILEVCAELTLEVPGTPECVAPALKTNSEGVLLELIH